MTESRATSLMSPRPPCRRSAAADELELPSIRELFNRHRRRVASAGVVPSLKEIELLIKLEQQVWGRRHWTGGSAR